VRLLTFTGPPGSGKTRLALEVAASLLNEFAHDVCFVDLAPISDPALVLSAMTHPFGVREAGAHGLLDSLKDYLWDKQALLVLDNFEQVLPAAPVIAELLAACPSIKMLVTSRAPLRLRWEHEFPVSPLALPDLDRWQSLDDLVGPPSVELFVERAQAIQPDFVVGTENALAVAEICVRLDGLPLSIELAAARSKVLRPQSMLNLLDSRLSILAGGPRDLPERQRTLRGAIGWSYTLLQADERVLYRRLGVFVGGCTLRAVEAVCDGPSRLGIGATEAVEALVQNNLLRRAGPADGATRFVMLETVREYALECLEASRELDALRGQHAAYYLALVEQAETALAGPEQGAWLERLEVDHDNMRAALRWMVERGEAELAVRLVAVLWRFWWIRGYLTEGRRRSAEVLELPQLAGRNRHRAKALLAAGQLALWQADYTAARTLLTESLEIARELGDPTVIAPALTFLGRVARDQGDDAATALGAESVEIFRQLGDDWGCGVALHFLGLAVARDDPAAAHSLFEESARLFRERGNRFDLAMPLRGLGLVAYQEGDYAAARSLFEEAAALFRERGDEWSLAMALHDLGYVAESQGDWRRAGLLLGESLRAWRRLGNARGTVMCLTGLAGVAAMAGRAAVAVTLFGAAEAIAEAAGIVLEPTDHAAYEHNVAIARDRLSAAAFADGWALGRAMPFEEAVARGLEVVESAATRPAAGDGGMDQRLGALTPRERDVAVLLADGRTNRQIAAALVITEGTANLHVKHILGKLGFTSRAQVAVWAAQHQRVLGAEAHTA